MFLRTQKPEKSQDCQLQEAAATAVTTESASTMSSEDQTGQKDAKWRDASSTILLPCMGSYSKSGESIPLPCASKSAPDI